MTSPNSEYQTIISKIDLLNEKLELYKKTNDEINSSMRAEIKAYQDANKQMNKSQVDLTGFKTCDRHY